MASRKTPRQSALLPTAIHHPPTGGDLRIGNPGNKGGTGRPPSEVRAAFLDALKGGPEALQSIIASTTSRDADRIAAIAAAAKIGLPIQVERVPAPVLTDAERKKQVLALLKGA